MATKYWIANNPNAEVSDAQCIALKNLSTADLTEIEDAVSSFDELRALAAAIPMAAVADLNQTISGSYVQAEVQAISDKVDALLAALRTAGLLTA
jgi:hypothetical protein